MPIFGPTVTPLAEKNVDLLSSGIIVAVVDAEVRKQYLLLRFQPDLWVAEDDEILIKDNGFFAWIN
jgi:hypothetical protein